MIDRKHPRAPEDDGARILFNVGGSAPLSIVAYFHCARCLKERPEDQSPQEWRRVDVGFTADGLQVWCVRHDMNVALLHFPPDWQLAPTQ